MPIDILSTLNTNGSGLNIADLSDSLTAAEIDPRKTLVSDRIDKADLSLSAYDRLRAQAESVDQALVMMRTLAPRQVNSDSSAVGVTLQNADALDMTSASLSVTRLAQAQVLEFSGFSSADADIGGGTLTVDFGTWSGDVFAASDRSAQTLTLAAGSTLSDLADALNGIDGVSAQVVDVGDGSYSLGVISDTGAANALRFSVGSGADAGLAGFDFQSGAASIEVQAAQDAALSLNGIAVTRPSNQIDDLLPGVSLTLNATTATPATLSVNANVDGSLQVMQSFVDMINATRSLIGSLTARGFGSTTAAGDLAGDSLAGGIMRRIDSLLAQGFGTGGAHLSDFGIATERDGTLTLDETRFTEVMTASPALLDPLLRDGLGAEGATVLGTPAEGTPAGKFTLLRDTATGAARLDGVPLTGSEQADGSWLYSVLSGPLQGVRLSVAADTDTAQITFAPSMISVLHGYLTDTLASGGTLDRRETALRDSVDNDNAALEDLDRRAKDLHSRYLSRFTAMEQIVTQLNTTGDYLTNLIDAWNSNNNN